MTRLHEMMGALARMTPRDLRAEWQALFGDSAPDVPASLLRRAIAHQLQEDCHGGLPIAAQHMLDAIGNDPSRTPETPIQLKAGSRLLREWNGKLHSVMVLEEGFTFDGRRFSSLTQIAHEITGTKWSGPRFFGLKRRPPPPMRVRQANG